MCLAPCAPYSDPFFSPRRDEGPETMSLCVFDGRPEACKELHRSEYLI